MLKHYVEFFFPGAFYSDCNVKEVSERNPELITIPDGAFAYRFFDQTEEVTVNGESIVGERENSSPLTYLGTEYTLEEVKAQFPEYTMLISNMEINGWNRVVKTREGNWYPIQMGEKVI